MPRRVLLTGACGFLGRHVIREFESSDCALVTLDKPGSAAPGAGFEHLDWDLIQEAPPRALPAVDVVVHLAAVMPPNDRDAMFRANVEGTANLLRALGDGQGRRWVLVSSSAVYGVPASGDPIAEDAPVAPVSAYGESMLARELAARDCARASGAELVILRLFNLAGPGQRPVMMIPEFAERLVRIELGLDPPILRVGRLDTARDFVDVRDAASAVVGATLALGKLPNVLNIASGNAWSGQQVLDCLLGLSRAAPKVQRDPALHRSGDMSVIVGNAGVARSALGWRPRYDLEQTIRDSLEHARRSVKNS